MEWFALMMNEEQRMKNEYKKAFAPRDFGYCAT